MAKKWDSDFGQKYKIHFLVKKNDFSFQFFNRSLVKSRRSAKKPTVLSSLLAMLTIPIILRNINFLTHFRIYHRGCIVFFCEKCEKLQIFRLECQWIGN